MMYNKNEMDNKYIVKILLLEYLIEHQNSINYPFWNIRIQRNMKDKDKYDIYVNFNSLLSYFDNVFYETEKALSIIDERLFGNIIIESTFIDDKIYKSCNGESFLVKDWVEEIDPNIIDEFCQGISPNKIIII